MSSHEWKEIWIDEHGNFTLFDPYRREIHLQMVSSFMPISAALSIDDLESLSANEADDRIREFMNVWDASPELTHRTVEYWRKKTA